MCSYCGGPIPDGDLWESRSTNTWLQGRANGAREGWAAAIALVADKAAAAFLSTSYRERERADFLRSLADTLREAAEMDAAQRDKYHKEHADKYPYADADEK